MKKILKFLFVLFLFLIILFGTGYWVIIVKEWPWWVFAAIVSSIAGIILGIFAVKKFLIRRNEKKFVQRVIKEEEAAMEQAPEEEQYKLKDMQTQWKQSIEKLRKSRLRKRGNPLYVLPWYMVMGESRTGKTSAIQNSSLTSPLTDVSQTATLAGTKNCDWWFFDQAIILDTAGRYTIPIDESHDKKEWQTFLTLLSKYRKKEPVNGVIVAVASNTLLNEDETSLSEKARNIRQRINQLMRILGVKFPVYLLVTKMDLVNGFIDFCDYIPEQRETQVMGYSNEEENPDCVQVLEKCMDSVFNRLRQLRTIFIQNRKNNFAVSFPNEFLCLKPGLLAYVNSLFGEDIYQATPLFRGIYFSSACRQGHPEPQLLKKCDIEYMNEKSGDKESENGKSSDKNKGYFLKNFFHAVLPGDRNIFTPVTEFIIWRKVTISLGIFALMLICLALCGVLTFSYYNNIKALHSYNTAVFTDEPYLSDRTDNILLFDRQRFELNKFINSNTNWILPRLGLNQSLIMEKKLIRRYVNNVKQNLVNPMDTLFFTGVDQINSQTSADDIVDFSVYAVQRINILKNYGGDEILSEKDDFKKSISLLFPKLDPTIPSAIASKFSSIYYDYIKWDGNESHRMQKLNKFQAALSKIADKTDNLHWLVSGSVCRVSPDIKISDFIHGYNINRRFLGLKVNGAYTDKGRNEIKKFILFIKKGFSDKKKFTRMENRFWAWYSKEFYREWYDFAVGFPKGKVWKLLTKNWVDAGPLMTTDSNPYFTLLDFMADEFNLFQKGNKNKPQWVAAVIRIKHIKGLAKTEKEKEKGSLLAKLSLKKDKIFKKMLGTKGTKVYQTVDIQQAADINYDFELAKKWNKYVEDLKTLSPATSYNEKCFHMFSDFFSVLNDPSKQESPFNIVFSDLLDLKTLFQQNTYSPEVFNLIKGPFDFFKVYGVYNTEKYLQNKWEEMVVGPSYSVDPEKYYSIMFDKNTGLIWKYINEYAAPFIDQSRTGFFPKKAFGASLPFNHSFLRLLNKGEGLSLEHQNEYTVSIGNLPVNINKTARIRPYSSSIVLNCADKKTELINNNSPGSKTFTWNPATCGDLTLSIVFQDITLQKIYKGKMGFAHFLLDFRDGRKIFNVSDFPDQIGYLTSQDVSDIIVSYKINGIEPVLKFLNRTPPEIPDIIFKNIKQKSGKYPVKEKKSGISEKKQKKFPQLEQLIRLKKKFKITMKTVPMGTNDSADVKPVSSILWMNCSGNIIRFENTNYPKTINFEWDPAKCGNVLLLIHFPKITLLKKYHDFFEFLKDFNYNSRTFTCDDFPKQKEKLLKNNISYIKITYIFQGDLPLLPPDSNNGKNKIFSTHQMMNQVKSELSYVNNLHGIVSPVPQKSPKRNSAADLRKISDGMAGELAHKPLYNNQDNKHFFDKSIDTNEWILKQNPDYYTIQIMSGQNRKEILDFTLRNNLTDKTIIYKGYIKGKETYKCIYGTYESCATARKSLKGLSHAVLKYSPFIRKFKFVQKEFH